ncbi:PrsW family glutamic-type intramembrane protease [Clostridium sp. ZS2-4]|uniref:PrsW family glutamic-type intramembrane protease n=1 Tax=Clostridium sp. ZS2-4 TaxID=2987703 RepID=UPI00227A6E14|nr:PrsW family glutamic-type intramembrane protease [Clostridium sp. ZS2-4]MCY6356452.1 PrsW family glutamic-type intramembrane protease [Clostridium sp. ZS2-4]
MYTRLFVIAVTPGIALALAAYLTDRYDREPISLLIKVFILGALSVIPTAIVEKFLGAFNIFGGLIGSAYTAFIVAGLTEEIFFDFILMANIPILFVIFVPYVVYLWVANFRKLNEYFLESKKGFEENI